MAQHTDLLQLLSLIGWSLHSTPVKQTSSAPPIHMQHAPLMHTNPPTPHPHPTPTPPPPPTHTHTHTTLLHSHIRLNPWTLGLGLPPPPPPPPPPPVPQPPLRWRLGPGFPPPNIPASGAKNVCRLWSQSIAQGMVSTRRQNSYHARMLLIEDHGRMLLAFGTCKSARHLSRARSWGAAYKATMKSRTDQSSLLQYRNVHGDEAAGRHASQGSDGSLRAHFGTAHRSTKLAAQRGGCEP